VSCKAAVIEEVQEMENITIPTEDPSRVLPRTRHSASYLTLAA